MSLPPGIHDPGLDVTCQKCGRWMVACRCYDIEPERCVKCANVRPANELADGLCECCGEPPTTDQPTP